MESYKIYCKKGDFEFAGEGPRETVLQDFEMWKEFAFERADTSSRGQVANNRDDESSRPDLESASIARLFLIDTKKKAVSLRMLPQADKNGGALMLILYGFKSLLQQDEVVVTDLKAALKQSGCTIDRIDEVANKSINAGLVNKGGRGKGGRYSITNAGIRFGKSLAMELLS